MKITLAQLNPTIADFKGNLAKLNQALIQAQKDNADIVVTSELFLCGYPPRDLLQQADFKDAYQQAVAQLLSLSKSFPDLGIVVGGLTYDGEKRGCYNSAFLIENGKCLFTQHKRLLPFYDVFDESRYFNQGESSDTVSYKGKTLGILICEDAWGTDTNTYACYHQDPAQELASKGADIFLVLQASPFESSKPQFRKSLFQSQSKLHQVPGVYVNQVGGNDELVFDGNSLVCNANGDLIAALPGFSEASVTVDLNTATPIDNPPSNQDQRLSDILEALSLGVRDYVGKTRFSKVLLGLSGGVDSALVAYIAQKALGKDNVLGVSMPSKYSSQGSLDDAKALAENLGIHYNVHPISDMVSSTENALSGTIETVSNSLNSWSVSPTMISHTEQNLQARLRGLTLMALSNQTQSLLLSTGNKSELAVGYCTLYGDMCGAFNPLADVSKTLVYKLCRFINKQGEIIPESTLSKPPSAELKPNQTDQDTLPDYDILDEILSAHIDEGCSVNDILAQGHDPDTVNWVLSKVKQNEYKRRQACPGLKISTKAFGMGRRFPMAAESTQVLVK